MTRIGLALAALVVSALMLSNHGAATLSVLRVTWYNSECGCLVECSRELREPLRVELGYPDGNQWRLRTRFDVIAKGSLPLDRGELGVALTWASRAMPEAAWVLLVVHDEVPLETFLRVVDDCRGAGLRVAVQ